MPHEWYNLDELAEQLGRDRREIEKLANRGRIPGRKFRGQWRFHCGEITHWLEREMREFTASQLEAVERGHQSVELDSARPLTSLLSVETVEVPLAARTKRSVLESLIEVAGRTWKIWEPAAVLAAVQQREELCSTAQPNGVALPHPREPMEGSIGDSVVAFGRCLSGIPFGEPGGELTDLFFCIICLDTRTHLQVLARLGRMLQLPEFLDELRSCETSQAAYDAITAAEQLV